MPYGRRGAVAVATDGHIAVVGGFDGAHHRSDIDVLELESMTWKTVPGKWNCSWLIECVSTGFVQDVEL